MLFTTAQQAQFLIWFMVIAARVVALIEKAANDDGNETAPTEYWVGVGSYDM